MRKFFGAKVIQANKSASSSSSAPSSRRRAATQRSNLTRPQSTWWSASQREGLSIRTLSTEEWELKQARHRWPRPDDSHEKWWTVDYSQRYKSMTKSFIRAVMSGREYLSLLYTLRIPLKLFQSRMPFGMLSGNYLGTRIISSNSPRSIDIAKVHFHFLPSAIRIQTSFQNMLRLSTLSTGRSSPTNGLSLELSTLQPASTVLTLIALKIVHSSWRSIGKFRQLS